MSTVSKSFPYIRQVLVYAGHKQHPLFGPYVDNIVKRIDMFKYLNSYREREGKPTWKVDAVVGEDLVATMEREDPKETLFVVTAGQSSHLDKVFSVAQTTFIKEQFFARGGLGYFNCGSAYWASNKRVYSDLCTEQPSERSPLIKPSNLPLFDGTAIGPLCPFPGKQYKVGFFSDAVTISDGTKECCIYLSGGGSFIIPPSSQKVRVLAKYHPSELRRLGIKEEDVSRLENAAIMISVGEGAGLLTMFHPYYGSQDFDVERYEKAFPDCGTNWRAVQERLSSLDVRMQFAFDMLSKLEKRELYT